MVDISDRQHISKLNIILVLLSCLASLATLAPDYNTGRPRAALNGWNGEASTLTVQVLSAEELIPNFDISATHRVRIDVGDLPVDDIDMPLWTLKVEGQDSFYRKGSFVTDNQGGYRNEDNMEMNDIEADLGTICSAEQTEDTECIPCSLTEGCTFLIDIDLCQTLPLEDVSIRIYIEADNINYKVTCHKSEDQTLCQQVDSWMVMESTPLEESLCENTEVTE